MIAMALACNPSLLIADEPTTALDVTIQAQILDLMMTIKEKRKEAAIILITHNLGVVAEICDRVIVMYGGKIQEVGDVFGIFNEPKHPYTRGLLQSLPDPYDNDRGELKAIPGLIPHILELPKGCKFCTRCTEVMDKCWTEEPELKEIAPGRQVRCHLF
jgi:oligopeptide/dipeptide ABC transporter ATP-binding protein